MTQFNPKTWTGDAVTSTMFNTEIKDHLNLLKYAPTTIKSGTGTSDFTRTGSTAYADISTTYFQAAITPSVPASANCTVEIMARFSIRPSDNSTLNIVTFDLLRDGTSVSEGDGIAVLEGDNTVVLPVFLYHLMTDVPGEVETTFKLQWKISQTARTARIYSNTGSYQQRSRFIVRER